jgi:putative Mn2+ efflux pump MntP
MITPLLLAISLSFDSFAVAVGTAIKEKHHSIKKAFEISVTFGIFQGLMPVIGNYIGEGLKLILASFDHWIAFFLLSGIGIRFIIEAFKKDDNIVKKINWKILMILGIATSIDALVAGIAFSFMKINIITTALTIAFVTFIITIFGYNVGKKLNYSNVKKFEILGGVILIGIGIKILVEHILF